LLFTFALPYINHMKKITVNIADQQDQRLKMLAQRLGIKQAELLRQLLEEGLTSKEDEAATRPGIPHRLEVTPSPQIKE
jgi:hypothetical protein